MSQQTIKQLADLLAERKVVGKAVIAP